MEKDFQHNLNKFQNTSNEEIAEIKSIISSRLGLKPKSKRGRPPKKENEKYKSIAIRMNPKVLEFFKSEAKKNNIGYQTLINKVLLAHVEKHDDICH